MVFMTQREAAETLCEVGLTDRYAREALVAGLAGYPIRARSVMLYEADAVRKLAARQPVNGAALPVAIRQRGVLVLRVRGRRDVTDDPRRAWMGFDPEAEADPEREEESSAGFAMYWSFGSRTLTEIRRGGMALVVSVSQMVVAGRTIDGAYREPTGKVILDLSPPGRWWRSFSGRRLNAGPGGAWAIWRPANVGAFPG